MKVARKPWMKFYPSDWRADAMLRLCSIGARGLWAEMMCIMHEADPYGSLLVNGRRIDKKQLAGLSGITEKECTALLIELEGHGVFSRDDDGTIYSRRMRRDFEKAEKDKENGKGGGNPRLKGGVNPQDNGADKAQRPEARGQSKDDEDDARARAPAKQPWELEPCHDLARQLAEIAGCADEFEFTGWGGATYRVKQWLESGWKPDLIIAAVREQAGKKRDGPAKTIKYFEPGIASAIAKANQPLPNIVQIPAQTVEIASAKPASNPNSASAAAKRLEARIHQQLAADGLDNEPYQPTYLRLPAG